MKKTSIFICLILFVTLLQAQPFQPKFFCFSDAFTRSNYPNDPVYQAKLLKEVGFDGVELSFGNPDQMDKKVEAMDQQICRSL
ncbi:MAG: hypothetical protein WKF91_16325 [Segetibacter sp.]